MLRDASLIPLSHDHHHALALCVLTNRSLAADPSSGNVAQQAALIVREFDSDLRRHFDVEERILFPALSAFESVNTLIAELLMEHRQLTGCVESLRLLADRAVIDEFCRVLQQHVRKEESRLFESAQQLLSRDQLRDLGTKLAAARTPYVCDFTPSAGASREDSSG